MFADDTTIPLPALYVESADPITIYTDGRSFAKRLWLDTSTGTIGTLKKRNAANSGWDTLINFDAPPAAHATSHQNGGGDEISVAGLSGVLADPQVPIPENVQDIVGAMIVAGTNVTVTYNDGAGTVTIDSTGVSGSIAPLQLTDANTVEQYNGTTNQVFRFYATRASSTNYEALKTYFDGGNGAFRIEAEKGTAGGSFRRLFIVVSGGIFQFNSDSFRPPGTDVISLGDAGNYWNQIFGNDYIARAAGMFRWAGRVRMLSPADGYVQITTDGGNPGTIANTARTLSQITSNQNNYDIAVPSYFLRASSDASRDITGLIVSNTTRQDGETHVFVNVGAQNIVLKHEDTNSTAANRFLCSTGADITLSANQAADLIYDSTTQRWRVFKRN